MALGNKACFPAAWVDLLEMGWRSGGSRTDVSKYGMTDRSTDQRKAGTSNLRPSKNGLSDEQLPRPNPSNAFAGEGLPGSSLHMLG